MSKLPLRARTQNGEWDGTAAADDMDFNKVLDYLIKKKLIGRNEFIVAMTIDSNELGEGKLFPPDLVVYVSKIPTTHSDAGYGVDIARQDKRTHIDARAVKVKVSLKTIFGFFKRFSIVLTQKSMEVNGRTLTVDE